VRVHYLMHVPHEALGNMEPWFVQQGFRLTRTRLYAGDPLPDPGAIDWLIIMGGPMAVYEEARYDWLAPEKRFIEQVLGRDIPVLGVCLGSQLLAEVLGGRVYRHERQEIGWFPVELTQAGGRSPLLGHLPETVLPLHWHGDTFTLPEGARHLASSQACPHQAFSVADRILGLQFHLEALPSVAQAFCDADAELLVPDTWVQTPDQIMADPQRFAALTGWMEGILEALDPRRC